MSRCLLVKDRASGDRSHTRHSTEGRIQKETAKDRNHITDWDLDRHLPRTQLFGFLVWIDSASSVHPSTMRLLLLALSLLLPAAVQGADAIYGPHIDLKFSWGYVSIGPAASLTHCDEMRWLPRDFTQ